MFTKWLNAVSEHALREAVGGKKWPGYKLVEGRSNRIYTDETKVAEILLAQGLKEDAIYQPKKILGITAMEKELGKSDFATHLSSLVIKPAGKPTLAPLTDKRPEYNSNDGAAMDFAEVINEDLM